MKPIKKLYFLIHGFCYDNMKRGRAASALDDRLKPYFKRENVCAAGWSSRLKEFSGEDALAVIPAGRAGAAADHYTEAMAALGDRFFMLDSPDCLAPEFWSSRDSDHDRNILSDIESAFVHQKMAWNKEEIHTALHSRGCCRQFEVMLRQRGYSFDPATVSAEAWGASFDGCVTKYSLNLRRILGLSRVVEINFDLTVPDAAFLLNASLRDGILLDKGVRLFLFNCDDQVVGLYTFTKHTLADPSARVTLTGVPETVMVKSKMGIRLWPQPEPYILQNVEVGFHEPPQTVVKFQNGGLQVPVSAGVVYRLAKAPAYVFMPKETPYADARSILISAKVP